MFCFLKGEKIKCVKFERKVFVFFEAIENLSLKFDAIVSCAGKVVIFERF